MKAGMPKYIEVCIIKTAVEKFQAYIKINRSTRETQKRKTERDLGKELEEMRNDIKEIKKVIMNKTKDLLETNDNT